MSFSNPKGTEQCHRCRWRWERGTCNTCALLRMTQPSSLQLRSNRRNLTLEPWIVCRSSMNVLCAPQAQAPQWLRSGRVDDLFVFCYPVGDDHSMMGNQFLTSQCRWHWKSAHVFWALVWLQYSHVIHFVSQQQTGLNTCHLRQCNSFPPWNRHAQVYNSPSLVSFE